MPHPDAPSRRRRPWRPLLALVVLLACLRADDPAQAGDPFDVPVRLRADWGRWDPDRVLRFTFHERRGRAATGRYVTYGIPIGHTDRWSYGSPDRGSSGVVHLSHRVETGPFDTITFAPKATSNEEWGGTFTEPPYFSSSIDASLPPTDRRRKQTMYEAKRENGPFPGYRFERFAEWRTESFHYVGEYCGFEMFESAAFREWHERPPPLDLIRPPPEEFEPPFDRARLFGWPTGDGVSYRHAFLCNDSNLCFGDERPRSWLKVTYWFRSAWLCRIPEIIPAHLDWLDTLVVEEERDILNPAFR
ncbi:MAG: hypothetical protein AAF390_05860 [Pseudomonadota bacterium]